MILPGITSDLGMLSIFPGPASSSARPLGLWLAPCSVLWLPALGFWKVALFLFGVSFACLLLAVPCPPTLPWFFPQFQACPSPYSCPWVSPLTSLSCCGRALGHPLLQRGLRAYSPSGRGGWNADRTRGACLLEFVVQGRGETGAQFTSLLLGSRSEPRGAAPPVGIRGEHLTWPGGWVLNPQPPGPLTSLLNFSLSWVEREWSLLVTCHQPPTYHV